MAFRKELLRRGFDTAQITSFPADITATKDRETFYFEVKSTRSTRRYFGAATLTEWEAAFQHEDRFKFVVASLRKGSWAFDEYTPDDFMKMSYIPPFKIFFNVTVGDKSVVLSRDGSLAVHLTRRRLTMMTKLYSQLRRAKGAPTRRPAASVGRRATRSRTASVRGYESENRRGRD